MAIIEALDRTPASVTGSSPAVSPENFIKCMMKFYRHWKEDGTEIWGSSCAIAVATPPPSEDIRYQKSLALSTWFFGHQFPETIMVFLSRQIHFLCSQKDSDVLKPLKMLVSKEADVDIVLHILKKGDDGSDLMPEGKFLEAWSEKLHRSRLKLFDVSSGISELLAVKDVTEIMYVKKAAFLAASVMRKYVVSKVEKIIEDEKKIAHSKLMVLTEKILLSPMNVDVKLKADNVDICYPPVFQSGGKYDLRPSASSNDDDLHYDSGSVIICALGAKYSGYCSNVARTFLIDCNAEKCNAYKVLSQAHDAAIAALTPGSKCCSSYQAAVTVIRDKAPELLPFLTKSAGTGMGIEFRESWLSLSEKNDRMLKEGMIFNVSLGFQNLIDKTNNEKTKEFSLWLADTVLVCKENPKVLTSFISKADSDAFYLFDEENAGLAAVKQAPKANVLVPVKPVLNPLRENLRSHSRTPKEDLRKQLQSEILKKKTSEAAVRSDVADHKLLEGLGRSRAMDELVAYKNANDVPVSNRLDIIQVDKQNEAILLPIYGVTVPFHVCTIKKAEIRGESSSGVYVSITFNVPGTASGLQDPRLQNLIFLKAVTFLSKNRSHAEEVIKSVKTVQKGVTERARRASLFPDLWIRPSFGGCGRKVAGTLVAHVNGFQYSASKTEKVDIMFSNIKHAFFQPAERDMITLLHFHLYNEIMVGNKKTRDVQFYTEVMDVVDSVGGLKCCSARDPDEIEEEQRDRARRKKINGQFELFVKRVVSVWSQPRFQQLGLHFERPSQKLGFNGVHGRTTCFIVPTPSCLVQLVESPFLVTSLREVEIVCLERVALGQKSFDMVFVFQDLKRDVVRIEVIPMASLDKIKDWLNDCNLKYYESKLNLNWRMVLKKLDEPGCDTNDRWEFLNPDATDSDSEDSETDDDKYEPSDAESASDSDDEDSDSESVVDSGEDEAVSAGSDDDDDAAESWDEMERKARDADMEMGSEDDSEDERQRRREKAKRQLNPQQSNGVPQKRQRVN
ncbi:FACT complex subunit SPT16 [Triticum urartu]|uniref:FACT complex subunit n=1 Tax=Triticum urartu TaxID=4572 RepID=M7YRC7_TRIUA|nr:FACT complex subunit SPT16 [Triticum urartu]